MLQICCFFLAWSLIAVSVWKFVHTAKEGIAYLQKLHQIPCDRCVFFTGDYRLKCTVNPITAMSEEAINCRDFEPTCPALKNRHTLEYLKNKCNIKGNINA